MKNPFSSKKVIEIASGTLRVKHKSPFEVWESKGKVTGFSFDTTTFCIVGVTEARWTPHL